MYARCSFFCANLTNDHIRHDGLLAMQPLQSRRRNRQSAYRGRGESDGAWRSLTRGLGRGFRSRWWSGVLAFWVPIRVAFDLGPLPQHATNLPSDVFSWASKRSACPRFGFSWPGKPFAWPGKSFSWPRKSSACPGKPFSWPTKPFSCPRKSFSCPRKRLSWPRKSQTALHFSDAGAGKWRFWGRRAGFWAGRGNRGRTEGPRG